MTDWAPKGQFREDWLPHVVDPTGILKRYGADAQLPPLSPNHKFKMVLPPSPSPAPRRPAAAATSTTTTTTRRPPPKSALDRLIEERRRLRSPLTSDEDSSLGEGTIASLEELVAESSSSGTEEGAEEEEEEEEEGGKTPMAGTPNGGDQENLLTIEQMNERLQALSSSLHEANRGIARLQGAAQEVAPVRIPQRRVWDLARWFGFFLVLVWAGLVMELTVAYVSLFLFHSNVYLTAFPPVPSISTLSYSVSPPLSSPTYLAVEAVDRLGPASFSHLRALLTGVTDRCTATDSSPPRWSAMVSTTPLLAFPSPPPRWSAALRPRSW